MLSSVNAPASYTASSPTLPASFHPLMNLQTKTRVFFLLCLFLFFFPVKAKDLQWIPELPGFVGPRFQASSLPLSSCTGFLTVLCIGCAVSCLKCSASVVSAPGPFFLHTRASRFSSFPASPLLSGLALCICCLTCIFLLQHASF